MSLGKKSGNHRRVTRMKSFLKPSPKKKPEEAEEASFLRPALRCLGCVSCASERCWMLGVCVSSHDIS